jgi:ectoine hydroxylase-related dioxygenase (phytanoyl-CoA dioxygenase family)
LGQPCTIFVALQALGYLDLDPCCAVCEATLGADCHLIQHKGWVSGPGRPGGRLHTDFVPLMVKDPACLLDGRIRVPIYLITAHYYLEDFADDDRLGPTLFVPGSHLSGRSPVAGEAAWESPRGQVGPRSARVKAGDCVLFRSDVWHSGSTNTSQDTRHLMQVHYCSKLISHRLGARYRHPDEREAGEAEHDNIVAQRQSTTVHNAPESRPEVVALANARQRRLLAGFSWPALE